MAAHRNHRSTISLPWAWVLANTALGYGLLLWLIFSITIVLYRIPELRELWFTPNRFHLTNFQIAVLLNLVFCALVLFSMATQWRKSRFQFWTLYITKGSSLAIGVAWLINLYCFSSLPLTEAEYRESMEGKACDACMAGIPHVAFRQIVIGGEPYDGYRVHLGQIQGSEPCPFCVNNESVLDVRLETGTNTTLTAPPSEAPVGAIVVVEELRGRFSGIVRHEYRYPAAVDDPTLFVRQHFLDPQN